MSDEDKAVADRVLCELLASLRQAVKNTKGKQTRAILRGRQSSVQAVRKQIRRYLEPTPEA